MHSDILIVDDEADIRELVGGILEDEGHGVRLAQGSEAALAAIEQRRPQLIFLDVWLQGSRLDGIELLVQIKEQHADLPVVMISGHGNIEMAVSAIQRGAYDFIEKPFKADRLLLVAARALENSKLRREVADLRQRGGVNIDIIGRSSAISQMLNHVDKIAKINSRVLICGPSGAGKELAARMIHARSARAQHPFVVLNAANMDDERWESELFGRETGHSEGRRVGALEEAHGGTLYIDEISDIPRETQGKILRVLVEQSFLRVGGNHPVQVDVRIVSSSSRDLNVEMSDGRLREDLFHRLSVVILRVPSLSERRDDIPLLVDHFVRHIAQTTGLAARKIASDTMAVLQSHDWPGNVRQLRNNVERMMILAGENSDGAITADMLPAEIGSKLPPVASGEGRERIINLPLREAREIFEREYLSAQIDRFGGNISRTADFVGMERSALHRKLKMLGLSSSDRTVETG